MARKASNMFLNLENSKQKKGCIRKLVIEFLRSVNTEILTDEQRECLDKKIAVNEYCEALKSFQKNKLQEMMA